MTPLCFVLMPFGKKPTSDGRLVDFDAVYRQLIHPAICAAGLQALRADEEQARSLGITGVPFFIIGERYALSGAQPSEVILGALQQAWAETRAAAAAPAAEGAVCGPDGCA